MSWGLCEHFVGKEREKVLEKHIELLKDDGIIVISVPHKYGLFYRLNMALQEILGLWSFGEEVPFTRKELGNFFKKRGYNAEFYMYGFYASIYDLFIRKPLKMFKIYPKRRFDNTKSFFDWPFGIGLVVIASKKGTIYKKKK